MLDSVSSPYALTGPTLVANGYSAIPIAPGSKRPGLAADHGMTDWQRFCERAPTKLETDLWCGRPGIGVGVTLGAASGGLVAIDIDSDDEAIIAAVEAVCASPVRKRGRKGHTGFFRASAAVKARSFKLANGDGVDLLAHGRQTVLPPTSHPDTGTPYTWLGVDTLEHVRPEYLPELPDDIADRLAEVLAPFGYEAPPERSATAHAVGDSCDDRWRETNEAALANLDAWVPYLGIGAKRDRAGWRAQAKWRNGDGLNVSFHPKGIRDFAAHVGYSPIDIVAKIGGCEPCEAMELLRDKLGLRDPEPVPFRLKMKGTEAEGAAPSAGGDATEPDEADEMPPPTDEQFSAAMRAVSRVYLRARIANGGEHPQYTEEVAAELGPQYREAFLGLGMFTIDGPEPEVEAPQPKPSRKAAGRHPLDGIALGKGTDWASPGGVLESMSEWILATARRPNRPLAVAASVAVLSTLCGRRLYGPTGTALNLYIACLAETSVGKDRPFKAVYELLEACGYGSLHQTAKVFSVTGFEQLVTETPVCTATVDELATNLLARISNKKASSHEATIKGMLQELWSRSIGDGPFKTTRRAVLAGDRGFKATTAIPSPSLTLFGVSTPQAFYSALTSGNIEDGFMNRFLIAPAAPRAAKAGGERTPVPSDIADFLRAVPPVGKGSLGAVLDIFSPHGSFDERELEWASARVEARANAFEEEILSILDAKPPGYPLLGRVFEYTVRLASLHAVSREGAFAKVGHDSLEWGAAWALESARSMVDSAASMMARNDHEEKVNAVSEAVRSKGELPRSELLRACRHINAREMDAIIKQLGEAGIITTSVVRGTKPKTVYAWIG
jgi:Bifunctional DNA primase/polymerase, N-terminal